jgi:hypothetical protein
MVTKTGEKKIFYRAESIPMDVDDDEPVLYPKSLASMPEDQRMSFSDLDEAYDMREWLK